ncbi:MAG: hypothetical protein U1B80_08190, partial [Anaerolineaceae bacterium]|nr:hypothetical protein [Anaerolineaceae bacterium]
LKAMGPSAGVLTELGRQLLAEPEPKPEVGFSADVLFTAQEKRVERILRVFSVDLVLQPARGGVFLRALNSAHASSCKQLCAEVRPQIGEMKLQKEVGRMEETNSKPERVEATLEGEETRRMRQQVCACLLDSSLAASHLPAAAAQRVRKAFSGRSFEAAELQAAIEDARQLVSELTATAVVQGPGRIHGMFSSEDQLQAAVDDLFGAPRQPGLQSLRAARLSGIRELYLMLTGDDELHGGFHAERARLATTADFSGLVRNAMNKVIANRWEELGRAGYDWWQRVAAVEHFNSLHTITGTLVGTVGALPAVAEGEDYPELEVGDSPETASFTKYGGYIPLTLELIDRDETRKLRAYPRELASAGLRKISALVAAVFTENDGVGPTMADGGSLFNSTLVTSRGGHANLSTGALSAERWDAVSTAVYNQPMLVNPAEGHYG